MAGPHAPNPYQVYYSLFEERKRQENGRQKKQKKRKLRFRKKVGPFLFLNRLLIFFCCIVRAILESENEFLKYYFMKTNNILNNILNINFNAGFVSCEHFCNKLIRIVVLNALNAIYPTVQIVLQRSKHTVNSGLVHKIQSRITKLITYNCLNKSIKTIKILSLTILISLICQNVEINPGPNNSSGNTFSVITFNCNGLGDKKKLKRLLIKLMPIVNNNCFVLLQETHIIDDEYLKMIWKHKYIMNGFTTNSAGVITLFNSKYDIKHVEKDKEGRRIIAVLEEDESKFIIANSYFPNDHRIANSFTEVLYTKMLEIKNNFDEHIVISGGDFNVCLASSDQLNRKSSKQERELAISINENNKLLELIDSYRSIHPRSGFSWKRGMTFSRLDYIFVSREVSANINTAKVDWAFENSDHAAVIIIVKLNAETVRGPGTTKLNVKILNNPDTAQKIEVEIENALNQANEQWNPHVKLEYLKVMIRSIFANEICRERGEIRNELEDREKTLNQMEEYRIRSLQTATSSKTEGHEKSRYESIVKSIEYLAIEITKLRNRLSETMAFVSKAKWYEKGEKSNKYFLNLHTMRQSQKLISNIRDESGEYSGQTGVMNCVKNFYESLYKGRLSGDFSEDKSFYENCPKLSAQNKAQMEQELSMNEIRAALMTCKTSAPDQTGSPMKYTKDSGD